MARTSFDVAVIGGGAAGLAGALQLGRSRRSVVVVDSGAPRNAPSAHMHGYLGFDGASPAELLARGRAEVAHYGVELRDGMVTTVDGDVASGFILQLADGAALRARRVLVATGLLDELPQIAGLPERWGRDVIHCPYCHGWEVRDQAIVVLDTNGMGTHAANLFRQLSPDVTLVVAAGPDPEAAERLRARGIRVVAGTASAVEVEAATDRLVGVRLADGELLAADAVAVGTRMNARADMVTGLGVTLADHPSGLGRSISTDATGATSVPGVYAAGNAAELAHQVLHAAASGSWAGAMINADLVADDVAAAVRSTRQAREWDARYASRGAAMWSGNVNGTFATEVADLPPGRALDVGCGEGADAIWLAKRGWNVTAVDVSAVAIERARAAAARAGVDVEWIATDLATAGVKASAFDLVSAQYPALPKAAGEIELRAMLDAVAPGGTLLGVWHAPGGHEHNHGHDGPAARQFDPADFHGVDDVAALLRRPDSGFAVERFQTRPRHDPPPGSPHVDDVVLRATRVAG